TAVLSFSDVPVGESVSGSASGHWGRSVSWVEFMFVSELAGRRGYRLSIPSIIVIPIEKRYVQRWWAPAGPARSGSGQATLDRVPRCKRLRAVVGEEVGRQSRGRARDAETTVHGTTAPTQRDGDGAEAVVQALFGHRIPAGADLGDLLAQRHRVGDGVLGQ